MAKPPIVDRKAESRARDYARENFDNAANQAQETLQTRETKARQIASARDGVMERRASVPRRAPPPASGGGLTAEFAQPTARNMSPAEAFGMEQRQVAERRVSPLARRAVSSAEALGMDRTIQMAEQNAAKLVAKKMAQRAAGVLLGPVATGAMTGYEVGQYANENFDSGARTLDALGIGPQYDPNSGPEMPRAPNGYRDGGAVKRKGKR